jgi:hypothetical protein
MNSPIHQQGQAQNDNRQKWALNQAPLIHTGGTRKQIGTIALRLCETATLRHFNRQPLRSE